MESPTPSPLSKKTHTEITALVRRISVAHHLDADIRAELAAHIEDKLTAYLTGEEKLTEADALLLAKAHFGKPATLKSLLHQTHAVDAHTSLARRLAAVLIATAGAYVLTTLIAFLFDFVSVATFSHMISRETLGHTQQEFYALVGILLMPVILTAALVHWNRQRKRGHAPWFHTLSPGSICIYVAGALAMMTVRLTAIHYPFAFFIGDQPSSHGMLMFPLILWMPPSEIAFALNTAVVGALWFWWCDSTPRLWRSIILTACVYFFFRMFFVDSITLSSFSSLTHRAVSLPFIEYTSIILKAYAAAELPGILIGALLFLLILRRRRPLLTTQLHKHPRVPCPVGQGLGGAAGHALQKRRPNNPPHRPSQAPAGAKAFSPRQAGYRRRRRGKMQRKNNIRPDKGERT